MKKKFWTAFLISLVCFSIIFTIAGKYLSDNNIVDFSQEDDSEDEFKDEILFLFMGIDANGGIEKIKENRNKEGDRYIETGNRTDTMMLCKFNFKTGETNILSIPRDTRVRIRGRKNEYKINAAYSYGGPYLAVDTVKDFLNIDLKYYVTVDYLAVKEIVDAIGGIKIDVPQDMKHNDIPSLRINIKKGFQTLDGDKAIEFLRYRGYKEADIGRIKAQQMFIKEFIKQVLKPKNIIKLPKMINAYFDYIDTNIPLNSMVKAVTNANKLNMENVKTETIPGDGKKIGKEDFWIYDENKTKELTDEMFEDFLIK
ncbi:LCP family protein [Sporanaerobacter sp. PP17-6a]|uniref:LCP family protein n=1 Tax=Sporanaerobacter sp. PP17-6a TaxID=1891289 RepID=UPI0008A048A6|nr:LCP family protein [Sporanaerobacter sp. PP17-6a]SCL89844.1 putative transcriptional regulator YvhJ [Sporanaerobacter sp. PP17-6a]